MTPDLLIIGGGPAGCAAALTAAGVGMRSLLVEREGRVCGKLHHIPALNNVLGGFRTGPDLAATVTADLADNPLCGVMTGTAVTGIEPGRDGVTITLDTGARHTAPHAVLATGVGPLQPADCPWITAPAGMRLPTLWEADAGETFGGTWLVLGADRPLGTLLRAHPDAGLKLVVLHGHEDAYKVEEVADDARVISLRVEGVTLDATRDGAPCALAHLPGGERTVWRADAVFANLGSVPTAPAGAARDASGHCPADLQHPRLIPAGDIRSARFQRIMTATGSGAEAALHAYYATRDLPI
ncbi:FAD-dependent oxidoreductase [Streptomyces sp. ST2-7A]|uniref:FAD-dependent oxidoreductase n=1 Tax=Streptomyces sp. ST2-7A TaxID=2907214 RepID=UPI001F32D328|nr:FAD-dependent oxidoreductase [Streptomyces sp. ST2-7A]MCE7082822.1 FAD-dependent oxidoreductase [Streptomyces sp. ST2-7A]